MCEELIRQNDAFPSQFQSQVASTDVIEQEILEQIREIDRMKTSMEAVNQAMPMPGMDAMVNLFIVMRQNCKKSWIICINSIRTLVIIIVQHFN